MTTKENPSMDLDELERWSRDKKAEGDDHVCLTFDVYDALIAAARRAEELEKALDRIVTEPQGSVRASIPYSEEGAPR